MYTQMQFNLFKYFGPVALGTLVASELFKFSFYAMATGWAVLLLELLGGVNLKFGEKASQQRLQGPALVCHAGILFANINLHYNIKVDHGRAVLVS